MTRTAPRSCVTSNARSATGSRRCPEPADRIVTADEIEAVLDEVGAVDTGRAGRARRPPAGQPAAASPPDADSRGTADRGRLYRPCRLLRIRVDWVRTIFVLAALVTAGLFVIVYIAMAFILPVVEAPEAV